MSLQTVDIATDDLYLRKKRGLLQIVSREGETKELSLDLIGCVVISSYRATLSKEVLIALGKRGIPVILTDQRQMPVSTLLSAHLHHESAGHIFDQVEASQSLKKRLWQQLVQAKLRHQAANISRLHPALTQQMQQMVEAVRSGDPDNLEAQGARLYWPALMGSAFRRDYSAEGKNAALNFGYAILRSTLAQNIVASGLHPALGVHHKNRKNPFCLADDLIEPFRPVVDLEVQRMEETVSLSPDIKACLVRILDVDLESSRGASPLREAITTLCHSLANSLREKQAKLKIARYSGTENMT